MITPTKIVSDPQLTAEMSKLGFVTPSSKVYYRLMVSAASQEKKGKTHFALTAPDPICMVTTDTGSEEIVKKFIKSGKKIFVNNFHIPKGADKSDKGVYATEWKRMRAVLEAVVDTKHIRTLVCDTMTEVWELCRLAAFGKLTQVMPHHYGPVNAEFREVVKGLYARSDLNVVLLHKMKKQYATNKKGDDAWNGKYEYAGMNDVPYLVDVNVTPFFLTEDKDRLGNVTGDTPEDGYEGGDRFGIDVIDNRINADVIGRRLRGTDASFGALGAITFPDSDPVTDWGM